MQIIYTDTQLGADGLPLNTSPAAQYGVTDLEDILDCIARGELECGTGEDFEVDWPDNVTEEIPWFANGPKSNTQWRNY
jgi:hypothetical protein